MVRERILSHAVAQASTQGFSALSLGDVARTLDLSRSGLFAHFATKESLQLGVLEQASAMFAREVIGAGPAETGEARLKVLFARWIQWSRSPLLQGGCPFVHASSESDALSQPVRARLKETLEQWSGVLAQAIEEAKQTTFRADLKSDQLVFELYGLYLSHHFWHWSMKDEAAGERAKVGFERLMKGARR